MIQIDLVDSTASVKHVAFHVVPVTGAKDFTCIPDGILPLRSVVRLSHALKVGRVFGHMGKYLWYRLKETPAGKHRKPIDDHQPRADDRSDQFRAAARQGA